MIHASLDAAWNMSNTIIKQTTEHFKMFVCLPAGGRFEINAKRIGLI